ncbi:MAG: lysylphosphatidylglycerol synthase transmembrane domain-containing protein [Candidatus Cloacimonadales bacterium]
MNKLKKNRIIYISKIVITLLILFFIFKNISVHQLLSNFKHIGWNTLLLLLLSTSAKYYIRFYNWGKYLKINPDYQPQNNEVLKSTFIGTALQFLLPGGYGTFGKMYYVENDKGATFVSVTLEKFFLTWTNLTAAAFASIFFFKHWPFYARISIFSLMLILPFLLFFAQNFLQHSKYERFLAYLKAYKNITPRIIALQFIYLFITFYQYHLILNTFSQISFARIIISTPLVILANTIPISYSGLGLRETFALEVFSRYGIPSEVIITATLSVFFFNSVLPALVGLGIILKGRL